MERALPTSPRMKNVMTVYKKRSAQSGLKDRGCVMVGFKLRDSSSSPSLAFNGLCLVIPGWKGFPRYRTFSAKTGNIG